MILTQCEGAKWWFFVLFNFKERDVTYMWVERIGRQLGTMRNVPVIWTYINTVHAVEISYYTIK